MLKMRYWIALIALVLVTACKKEEIITIPGNVAPPDGTVEDVTIESYVNRAYISLLGRKPDDTEFSAKYGQLRSAGFERDARRNFIDALIASTEFDQRAFAIGRVLLLNGADTTDIREQRDVFNFLLSQPQYQAIWPEVTVERDKLNEVLAIPTDFAANTLDIREMHRRLVYNYFYDQINMGTQNFVISMFQNLLFRYPTAAELAAGETMVDGFTSNVFLENGRNKEDFVRIFLDSGDYCEGQVRDIHLRLLFREPSTQEIEDLAVAYKGSNDYAAMLIEVLSSDEFAGI